MYSGVMSFALGVPPPFRLCTPLSLLSCLPGDRHREGTWPANQCAEICVYQLSLETFLVSVEQVMLTVITASWIAQTRACQQPSWLSLNSRYSLEKISLWMTASMLIDLVLYILLGSQKRGEKMYSHFITLKKNLVNTNFSIKIENLIGSLHL